MPYIVLSALALITLRFLYRSVRRDDDVGDAQNEWPHLPRDGSRGYLEKGE